MVIRSESIGESILDELRTGLSPKILEQITSLNDALTAAKRVFCYGVGREGLMMRAYTMRLFHMGLDVHVVGDMTVPAITNKDILLVSAGPGSFSTVKALIGIASDNDAKVVCITAETDGEIPTASDLVVYLPAQTMATDQGADSTSVLPMGSLYEAMMLLFFEVAILKLREKLSMTLEDVRSRHTNLE